MAPVLALLPSPLLGPVVWQPVAASLTAQGWQVVTGTVGRTGAPRTPQDVLDAFLAALPDDQELVLVPHSNAGLYVPAVAARRRVVGCVFVDALVPPRHGRVPIAPPEVLDALRAKADVDGVLPPWTGWWAEDEVAALFPDEGVRRQVEREQQRLPLSYFEGSLAVPAGWAERPGAYLAFGDTYARDRAEASRRAWPVVTLPGRHLHMLVEPEQVAAQIDALVTSSTG